VTNKGVDLTGLLGDIKEHWGSGDGSPTAGSGGQSPIRGSGGRSTPEAEAFFVKLHIKFALKYNKQQLLPLLDKINLAAKYENSKILGGTLPWTSPLQNYWGEGDMSPLSHRDRRPW